MSQCHLVPTELPAQACRARQVCSCLRIISVPTKKLSCDTVRRNSFSKICQSHPQYKCVTCRSSLGSGLSWGDGQYQSPKLLLAKISWVPAGYCLTVPAQHLTPVLILAVVCAILQYKPAESHKQLYDNAIKKKNFPGSACEAHKEAQGHYKLHQLLAKSCSGKM